jgi:hypothetical protein
MQFNIFWRFRAVQPEGSGRLEVLELLEALDVAARVIKHHIQTPKAFVSTVVRSYESDQLIIHGTIQR